VLLPYRARPPPRMETVGKEPCSTNSGEIEAYACPASHSQENALDQSRRNEQRADRLGFKRQFDERVDLLSDD
jgi:hypothetical protein